jgi:hypothetical protein
MLVVLVMANGLGLGWFVSAYRQREAVAALERAGCTVRYDWQPAIEGWRGHDEAAWEQLLRNCLGADCFSNVVAVDFCTNGSNREMLLLSRFRQLEDVSFAYSPVSNASLAMLNGLSSLTRLNLRNIKVSRRELALLIKSNRLKSLDLARTDITDAELGELNAATSLEELWLDHTAITDAGLSHLRGLIRLSHLSLVGTAISDAGLVQLKNLSSLDSLEVLETRVTDAGVLDFHRALPRTRFQRQWDSPWCASRTWESSLVQRAKQRLDSEARREDHRVSNDSKSPPLREE